MVDMYFLYIKLIYLIYILNTMGKTERYSEFSRSESYKSSHSRGKVKIKDRYSHGAIRQHNKNSDEMSIETKPKKK